jgi:dethiobiotin synthetase
MRLFITGTGTGIGKTLVSAILAEAFEADYWKPVQAGYADGTDSEWIKQIVPNEHTIVHPETYKLKLAASPHISAREEGTKIDLDKIARQLPRNNRNLIIEGAGGLMVPLNDEEFVIDLIKLLEAKVILVSRNFLGSINHSLLTAMACRQYGIPVAGWIFNDNYLDYENEIVKWSGYPKLASVPGSTHPDREFIVKQASEIKKQLASWSW